MKTIWYKFRCWWLDLCPLHNCNYSYRYIEVDGPMSGYYACEHDWQWATEKYCPECEVTL
jgi:hypothetical protein